MLPGRSKFNTQTLKVRPPRHLKLMFDYCSEGLWESSGMHFDIERLKDFVPARFLIELGQWLRGCNSNNWLADMGEEQEVSAEKLQEDLFLDRKGILLAQELAFHLRAFKPVITYSPLSVANDPILIEFPRPAGPTYLGQSSKLKEDADQELDDLIEALKVAQNNIKVTVE